MVYLPGNCTHILQVLDVVFFFTLKSNWQKILDTYRIKHKREIAKEYILQTLQELFEAANFKETIKNGFECCGLFPFNEDREHYTKIVTQNLTFTT